MPVVIGTAIWTTFFFGFLVVSALTPNAIPGSWFLDMIKEHPAGTIGIAICAISSFCSCSTMGDLLLLRWESACRRKPLGMKRFILTVQEKSAEGIVPVMTRRKRLISVNYFFEVDI